MNIKSILAIAAVAALSSGFASADEADGSQYGIQFHGQRTRAEVKAELVGFQKAGVNPWDQAYNPLTAFNSTLDRAQVTAQYIASRAQVASFAGEDSGSVYLAQHNHHAPDGVSVAGQPGADVH
jgi:hypothetical protein